MSLGIWLCSLHSVKNISHFKYSSIAPKQHSQVTRHQSLYLTASNTLVLTGMAQFGLTLAEQFLIVCIVRILWEALFGGDLFIVTTHCYQTHNLVITTNLILPPIAHTGINPAKHLSVCLILSTQVVPFKLMESLKCSVGSGPVLSASCSVKYAEQELHLIASDFNWQKSK